MCSIRTAILSSCVRHPLAGRECALPHVRQSDFEAANGPGTSRSRDSAPVAETRGYHQLRWRPRGRGLHPSVMEGTHFMSFKAPDLTVAFGALFQDELKIDRIPLRV